MAPLLLCQQRTLKTPLSVLLVPVVLLSYAPRRSPRNRLLSCEFDSSNHFFYKYNILVSVSILILLLLVDRCNY